MLAVLLTCLILLLEHEHWTEGADTSADQIRLGVGTNRISQDVREGLGCFMRLWETMSARCSKRETAQEISSITEYVQFLRE